MTTILEALQNSQINLDTVVRQNPALGLHPIFAIAKCQLDNAVKRLEEGKLPDDPIDEKIVGQ